MAAQHALAVPVGAGAVTVDALPYAQAGAGAMVDALTPGPDGGDQPTDAELIASTRAGDLEAFGVLYARHVVAARRMAHGLTRNPADADDLTAEAFTKVLSTLRAGRGPNLAFRAYLLAALRNVFHDRVRRDRRISLTDDLTPYDQGEPFVDTPIAELDRSCAARAFAKLPDRWRAVLWYTEIEGGSPTAVAPLLGLTPNGVAALAYRARERLRQIYLQEHVRQAGDPRCRWTTDRLAGYVRGALSPRDRSKVDRHLSRCAACRSRTGELGDLNSALHAVGSAATTPPGPPATAPPGPPATTPPGPPATTPPATGAGAGAGGGRPNQPIRGPIDPPEVPAEGDVGG